MITRAQAEALLTLAEALEACERVGAGATVDIDGELMELPMGWDRERFQYLNSVTLRLAISAATPKSIGS